jgi:ATP-dependent Lhr-like helicase
LLARIHRLTIDRLRAEIQPVSSQEFYRFLFAWQRVDAEHRAEGPEGLASVLELLDGCELPLASWEPEVLSARVAEYDSQWLDRLCFSGRIGWGRLTAPQHPRMRAFAPLRTSPIALHQRESLADWLHLADAPSTMELSPDTRSVLETLAQAGALFFLEIVRRTSLLPSQVEQALTELAALGFVTSDSFDGLRALLVPSDKRPTLGRNEGKRRRKTNLANIEFAGRWSVLRGRAGEDEQKSNDAMLALAPSPGGQDARPALVDARDAAHEQLDRAQLRRYGGVFRRLIESEAYEWITLSAADPLNLAGILTPGPRIAALTSNRILFRDGLPIAALEGGEIQPLSDETSLDSTIEKQLKVRKLPAALRPYYR